MFCPFCGDELIRHNGELYCKAGDVALSPVMEQLLTTRYSSVTQPITRANFTPHYNGGLNLFCPGCGQRVDKELTCSRCGNSLKNLVYPLLEFHPHRQIP